MVYLLPWIAVGFMALLVLVSIIGMKIMWPTTWLRSIFFNVTIYAVGIVLSVVIFW